MIGFRGFLRTVALLGCVATSAHAEGESRPIDRTPIFGPDPRPGASRRMLGGDLTVYEQVWDGTTEAFSSQRYSDRPAATRIASDDLTLKSPTRVTRIVAYGIERGDPQQNRGVYLRIGSDPRVEPAIAPLFEGTGQQVGGDLVFDFDPPLSVPAGTYWVSAWINRPLREGGQWFWAGAVHGMASAAFASTPAGLETIEPRIGKAIDLAFAIEAALSETCAVEDNWTPYSNDISAGPIGEFTMPFCEPVCLYASAVFRERLEHLCKECDFARQNHFYGSPVTWSWSVSGWGFFGKIVGQNIGSTTDTQQVLFRSFFLNPNEQKTAQVTVSATPDEPCLSATGGVAMATFSITIRREDRVEETVVSGVTIEEVLIEYVYDIQVLEQDVTGGPLPAPVSGNCTPILAWGAGAPITGDFAPADSNLENKDLLLIESNFVDLDFVEVCCLPDYVHCFYPNFVFRSCKDQLVYTWTASAGTFPCGNTGEDVLYAAPEVPGPVTIMVTVVDVGGQVSDGAITVAHTYQIAASTREALIGTVGWIDASTPGVATLPGSGSVPPPTPPAGGHWEATEHLKMAANSLAYRWVGGLAWQLFETVTGAGVGFVHPWAVAATAVKESANPPPPGSFADLAALRAWMAGKEYRAAMALKFKLILRRGQLICFAKDAPDFDLVMDEGWTPARSWVDRQLIDIGFGIDLPKYSRGEFQGQRIRVEGLCTSTVKIIVEQEFRLGTKANQANQKVTNRDAPWIKAKLEMTVRSLFPTQPSDLILNSIPSFPSYNRYWGPSNLTQQGATVPSMSVIDFINIGPKINLKGV